MRTSSTTTPSLISQMPPRRPSAWSSCVHLGCQRRALLKARGKSRPSKTTRLCTTRSAILVQQRRCRGSPDQFVPRLGRDPSRWKMTLLCTMAFALLAQLSHRRGHRPRPWRMTLLCTRGYAVRVRQALCQRRGFAHQVGRRLAPTGRACSAGQIACAGVYIEEGIPDAMSLAAAAAHLRLFSLSFFNFSVSLVPSAAVRDGILRWGVGTDIRWIRRRHVSDEPKVEETRSASEFIKKLIL